MSDKTFGRYAATRRAALPIAVCAVGLIGLAGCAAKAPTAQLARAELAVRKAERAGGAEHAVLELHLARQKVDEAKTAISREKHDDARRLLEQAEVDAELAGAKARAAKTRQTAEEAKQTIESLRTETGRRSQ